MARPIDREPRGTPEYEEKLARLDRRFRLIVELAEESILADRGRQHSRRRLDDGTTFDLTAYDEFGVLESFRLTDEDQIVFIDFALFDPH